MPTHRPRSSANVEKMIDSRYENAHPDPDTERPEEDPKPQKEKPQHYVLPPRCADMVETYRCTGEETDLLGSYTGNAALMSGIIDPLTPRSPNPLAGMPGEYLNFPIQDADDL